MAHLTLSFSPGGRREAIAALAQGLAGLGVENHLCCLEEFGCDGEERSMFASSQAMTRKGLFDRNVLAGLRRFCHDRGIDLVHSHDAASQAMAALAMPLGGPTLLMTFHRSRSLESASLSNRLRNALVSLRTGAVVTASRERRQHYLDNNTIAAGKLHTIPLGIDLDLFRPDPDRRQRSRAKLGIGDDELLIGTVGHFGREKGVDLAIDAFQQVLRTTPGRRMQLAILGRGAPDDDRFVRNRVDPSLADRIHFLGFQPHPQHWFPAFDILLHGARVEAFGLVLAEAQACGTPVVAASVGGIPDVVVDSKTGHLAATASGAALADALGPIVVDDALRGRLAAQAIEHARTRFGCERYARDYLDLYRDLLA